MRSLLFSQSDLRQLQRHLINSAYGFLAWVLPAVTLLSFLRIPFIGLKPVMVGTLIASCAVILVYRQRHLISTSVKLWIIAVLSILVAMQSYLSFFEAPRMYVIFTLSVLFISCGASFKVSVSYSIFAALLPVVLVALMPSKDGVAESLSHILPGTAIALTSYLMMSYLIAHQLYKHLLRKSQNEYQALRTDMSTGGLNEMAIREQIDQLLSDKGAPVVRIYLLHLREIVSGNNQYSRDQRDQVSTYLSAALMRSLPNNVVHGRSGAGHFIVVAPRADWSKTESALRGLKAEKIRVDGRSFVLDPVVVTTDAPSDGVRSDRLLDNLGRVLERALRDKLDFARFLPIDKALLDNEYLFVGELSQAMDAGDLQLFLQPKINMQKQERIVGAEALIRWDHPAQGLLSPAAFMQQIENSNSRTAFAQFVIRQSGMMLKRIQEHMPEFELSFNLSAYDLQDLRVLAELQRVMEEHEFAKNTLQIEISESQTTVHVELVQRSITAIRELGYSISLDDFGTGMCSLAYFSELPVDAVKIDRAFLSHIETSEPAQQVVRSIVDLCSGLQRTVLIEGIETAQQANIIAGLGCYLMQGYLFGRPLNLSDFIKQIDRQRNELHDELI